MSTSGADARVQIIFWSLITTTHICDCLQGAEDYRADAQLHKYCLADAKKLCSDVTPGGGRVQACLVGTFLFRVLVSSEGFSSRIANRILSVPARAVLQGC